MTTTLQQKIRRALALVFAALLLCSSTAFAATRYSTLEFGSRGSTVLTLQKALLSLGYDPNGTDGKFGRGTENAIIAYQNAKGLEADGKAGNLTQTAIYADLAAQGGSSSGSSGGSSSDDANYPTASSSSTLQYGDSGSRVTELQTWLNQLGYDTNGIDGKFGAGTRRAVIAFQKANGLTADGLAGKKTVALVQSMANNGSSGGSSSGDSSSGGSSSGDSSGSSFTRTLRKGYTGEDVRSVQARLQELEYYTGSLDGVYGTGSMAAVKAFQQRNGLTADGLAGQNTFTKLFSSSAVSAGSSATPPDDSGSSGGSSGDSSSGTYVTLRLGDKGDAVKQLQQALKSLGYNVSTDGDFGALTQMAVIAFQQRNGLTTDGVAGAGTQTVLFSGSAIEADKNNPGGSDLPPDAGTANGPSASEVKLLHWFNDIKPTIKSGQTVTVFDPATNLQWQLRFYSLGRHADSEPKTLQDTQIMFKAFGNTNTWTPKPVYVKLPSGTWTLAAMHNVPHLSGSIKDNGFDGHLCVHFLRDMEECKKNDPDYGVTNQNAIRKKWKQMTGITVE